MSTICAAHQHCVCLCATAAFDDNEKSTVGAATSVMTAVHTGGGGEFIADDNKHSHTEKALARARHAPRDKKVCCLHVFEVTFRILCRA